MVEQPAMPECDRMLEQGKKLHTEAIGEFLDWASSQGWQLCTWDNENQEFNPIFWGATQILAKYAEIDMDKVEKERRALLEYLRGLGENDA